MSEIKIQIQETLKTAMRQQEKKRVEALRFILAAIKQKEIDERVVLEDVAVMAILDKQAKQRRESIEQYEKAARSDLVSQEQFELDLIQSFLPKPLEEAEVLHYISDEIKTLQAHGMKDMAKVMAALKPKLQGRTDLGHVSALVKQKLS